MVFSCLYHLANFPKLINIGWGVSISKPKSTSDGVKVAFINGFSEAIGAWICLVILQKSSIFHPEQVEINSRRTN